MRWSEAGVPAVGVADSSPARGGGGPRRRRGTEGALLAITLLAAPALAHAADPAPVVKAERAFAARALEVGVPRSFLETMADEAMMFAPLPTSAKALYAARLPGRSPAEGGPRLVWWPVFAGLSASGDLGFTTGPAEINGRRVSIYFTVWKKQADGSWRWVYDSGPKSDPSTSPGPDAPVRALPAGAATRLAPAAAFGQVKAREARLAAGARRDQAAALRAVLAADARVQGSPLAPAQTPAAVEAELATRAPAVDFALRGGGASEAGDLAWTWGEAVWPDGRGHFVRVWQRRPGGWTVVFDQLLPARPD